MARKSDRIVAQIQLPLSLPNISNYKRLNQNYKYRCKGIELNSRLNKYEIQRRQEEEKEENEQHRSISLLIIRRLERRQRQEQGEITISRR